MQLASHLKYTLLLLLLGAFTHSAFAQQVMIIPFYKKGESRQIIIENDPCFRYLETEVKRAFLDLEGFGLIDYLAAVRKLQKDKMYNENTQQDLKTALLRSADPDVYIIADIEKDAGGGYHWMFINLTAYHTSTSKTVGAVVIDSGRRKYDSCQDLIGKGLTETDANGLPILQNFVQQIKTNINGMDKGIPVSLQFNVSDMSLYHYMTKLSDRKLLAMNLKSYVQQKAMNKVSSPNVSKKMVVFKEVVIPVRHPETQEPYTASDFAFEFYAYLTELEPAESPGEPLDFEVDVTGNNIYFTMN